MDNFDLNILRKDMTFIEDTLSLSNTMKRQSFQIKEESKTTKKSKNLKYFLKKKRNITYKVGPH